MEALVPCSLEQVPKGAMGLTWGRVLQGHPNSQRKSQEIPICPEEVAKASISHIPFLCPKVHLLSTTCPCWRLCLLFFLASLAQPHSLLQCASCGQAAAMPLSWFWPWHGITPTLAQPLQCHALAFGLYFLAERRAWSSHRRGRTIPCGVSSLQCSGGRAAAGIAWGQHDGLHRGLSAGFQDNTSSRRKADLWLWGKWHMGTVD